MTPTPEQQAILKRLSNATIKVAADAGCVKTSTLVEYSRAWPWRGLLLNDIAKPGMGRRWDPPVRGYWVHASWNVLEPVSTWDWLYFVGPRRLPLPGLDGWDGAPLAPYPGALGGLP